MRRLPILFMSLAGLSLPAPAIEYWTVESATILYDTPNARTGTKQYVIRRDTPVEVVHREGGWAKVLDAEGKMAWIDKKALSARRTLIVKVDWAIVLQKPEEGAPVSFEAERNVSLNYLETLPGGWIKVSHRDGQEGFVRAGQVWGF